MTNPVRDLLAFANGALLIQGAHAATVSGPAIIVDGDTIEIDGQAVRIHGIDAPETAQRCQLPKGTWDCAQAAIAALAAMTDGKAVICMGSERDQYGRLICPLLDQ